MTPTTRMVLRLSVAVVVAAASAQPIAAQLQDEPRKFWISVALGGGVNLDDQVDGDQLGGGSAYIRLGGTPSRHVRLGFEAAGWTRKRDGRMLGRGNASFIMSFHPSAHGGPYVKGGLGGARISRVTQSGSTRTTTRKLGLGLTAGAGWELPLGRHVYLTPNLDLLYQAFESDQDPVLGHVTSNAIMLFTLGLTRR